MNRIYKFRAWDGKKMRSVDDIDFRYPKPLILDNDSPAFVNKETGQWELMQFTGLHDVNGKEIYEGDVVKYKHLYGFDCGSDFSFNGGDKNSSSVREVVAEVEYKNGQFYPREDGEIVDDGYYSWRTFDFEVIGNRYENPELLKNK